MLMVRDQMVQLAAENGLSVSDHVRLSIDDAFDTRPGWGRFAPAIERWERVTGNVAPDPTLPDGKDGNHRLSSRFTEWMMGLEPGFITDCGIGRREELRACGNGVVPQQAKLALKELINRLS